MIEFSFPLPEKPWSTNQDRNMNPHQRHQIIRAWKWGTGWAWKTSGHQGMQLGFTIVRIDIPFKQRRRRDPHNYCGTVLKAVIDGLVEMGVWPDDNPEWVGHREPRFVKGETVTVRLETSVSTMPS